MEFYPLRGTYALRVIFFKSYLSHWLMAFQDNLYKAACCRIGCSFNNVIMLYIVSSGKKFGVTDFVNSRNFGDTPVSQVHSPCNFGVYSFQWSLLPCSEKVQMNFMKVKNMALYDVMSIKFIWLLQHLKWYFCIQCEESKYVPSLSLYFVLFLLICV